MIKLNDILIETERRAVRTMRLTVYPDGRVRLVVPWHTSDDEAQRFVEQKAVWIRRHYAATEIRAQREVLHYQQGERHLLMGKPLPLRVEYTDSGAQAALLQGEEIVLYCRKFSDEAHRMALMQQFYRNRLHVYLKERLAYYTSLYKEAPVSFRIRQMKTEWGSCMARKRALMFNLQLAKTPEELIDYVIVHELCHLQVQNHGPLFQRLLTERMPDWKERKQRLREYV